MIQFASSMIVLQERDLRILREIATGPACTRGHIAKWIFADRYEAAKKRIQALIVAGFIEAPMRTASPRILRITDSGRLLLCENGISIDSPAGNLAARLFDHEISLTSCRLAFHSMISERDDVELAGFSFGQDGFSIFCPTHLQSETVRPDGICALRSRNRSEKKQVFFLEIDRSTETQERLVHLALQYRELLKSCQTNDQFAFRVLLIFKSARRLINAGNELFQTGRIKTLVWLATQDLFEHDPLGQIWLCPSDFSDGTPGARRRLL